MEITRVMPLWNRLCPSLQLFKPWLEKTDWLHLVLAINSTRSLVWKTSRILFWLTFLLVFLTELPDKDILTWTRVFHTDREHNPKCSIYYSVELKIPLSRNVSLDPLNDFIVMDEGLLWRTEKISPFWEVFKEVCVIKIGKKRTIGTFPYPN